MEEERRGGRGLIGWLAGLILLVILVSPLAYFFGFGAIDNHNQALEEGNCYLSDNSTFQVTALYDQEFLDYFNGGYLASQKNLTAEETIEKIVERVSQSWERQVGVKFVLNNTAEFNCEENGAGEIISSLQANYPLSEKEIVIVFSGKYFSDPIVRAYSSYAGNYFVISYPEFGNFNLFFRDPYFAERSAYLLNQKLGKIFGFIEIKQPNIAIPDFESAEDYQKFKNDLLKEESRNYFKQALNSIFPFTTNLDLDSQRVSELSIFASQMGYDTGFDHKYSPDRISIHYGTKKFIELNTFKNSYQESYEKGTLTAKETREKETSGELVLRDPTYEEIKAFLEKDSTDKRIYLWKIYMCHHYSLDAVNHAKTEGIKAGYVFLDFPGSPAPNTKTDPTAHAIICFNTTDKGLVFIEPQSDRVVSAKIGQSYWGQNNRESSSNNDTIVRIEITWSDGTKTTITEN